MLDPQVGSIARPCADRRRLDGDPRGEDHEQARKLGRDIAIDTLSQEYGSELVEQAREADPT